jgi:hypothetical protein
MVKNDEKTGTERALQIGPRKLKQLAASGRSAYRDSRKISGAYGEQVRNAVEHDHLHKQAFSQAMKEDRMEPAELNDFYSALDYYRDELGLLERAKSAPRLPIGDNVVDMNEAAE